MHKLDLILLLKTFSDCTIDNPFSNKDLVVARHKSNKKWFALIINYNGNLAINLKCEPMKSDFLRSIHSGVIPAWHMNKIHWNTVIINKITTNELTEMICDSYELTK